MREKSMKAVHVIVTGRVHGVGFRAWTADEARPLRVTGWVRNLRDGTVEAVFCGAEVAVDEMVNRVKVGPIGARVEKVATSGWDGTNFDSFAILSTQNL
jgi:acylphosphatase